MNEELTEEELFEDISYFDFCESMGILNPMFMLLDDLKPYRDMFNEVERLLGKDAVMNLMEMDYGEKK